MAVPPAVAPWLESSCDVASLGLAQEDHAFSSSVGRGKLCFLCLWRAAYGATRLKMHWVESR